MTRRLLLSYLSITLFVLVLLEVPLGIVYGQREHDRFESDAALDAAVLASFYEDVLEHGGASDPAPARAYQARTGARVVVVDREGLSVVDTESDTPRDFSTRPEIESALTGNRDSGSRRSETLDRDLVYVAVPVASGGVVHGAVRLTLDAHDVNERVRALWWALVATAAVVLATVAVVGWLLARSVTRPVRHLRAAAHRHAEGDLTPSSPPTGAAPELVELSDSLNSMARRLDELLSAQRAFVADASHQLRTPLTSVRLQLENLEAQLDPPGAAQVAAVTREIERLTDIVADLLQLARAERPAAPADVDLAGLARDRVDTWQAAADAAGVRIAFEARAPVVVSAIPGAVEQVLDNLLDNALQAAPDDSVVEVAVRPVAGSGELTVADHGAGLTDRQKSLAVQRFWRADAARSGTGLGLAIVDQLVTASRGTLRLEDSDTGGLKVVVRLPAAAAERTA